MKAMYVAAASPAFGVIKTLMTVFNVLVFP